MFLSLAKALFFFVVGLNAHSFPEVADRIDNKITSRDLVSAGEFPYMSILLLKGDLCEGTLVGPSHILTAAQCLFGRNKTDATNFTVLLNTLTTGGGNGGVRVGVTNFIVHEKFNPTTKDNDVAILVLQSPVTGVPTVTLPNTSEPTTTQPTSKPSTTTKSTTKFMTTGKPTTAKPTTNPTLKTSTTNKPTTQTTKMTTKTTNTTQNPTTNRPTTPTTKMSTMTANATTQTTRMTTKTTTTTKNPTTTANKPNTQTTKMTTRTITATSKPTTLTTKLTSEFTTKSITTQIIKKSVQINSESMSYRAFSTYANSPAVVTGWGTTISPGGSISNTLLKANVIVRDNAICTSQYAAFVSGDMLCASFTGSLNPSTKTPVSTSKTSSTPSMPPTKPTTAKPLCSPALDSKSELMPLSYFFSELEREQMRTTTCQQGIDIGGPLFVGGVQVGINSFGYNIDCADSSYTGVYTRVTTYLAWIAATMANNP